MRQAVTFYKFVPVNDHQALRAPLFERGQALQLKGSILLAEEGVNGTLVGSQENLEQITHTLQQYFGPMTFKWSDIDPENEGFYRLKVKLKQEIVTLGVADLDMSLTGEHVDVMRWNELLEDPDVVVIDTRNQYEIDIGTFPGAVSPGTENFRDFPAWVAENLDAENPPPVAMFCTGGIRCEKASAYMRQHGFDEVYQLDGGVLNYLEHAAEDENRWQGECFVFDQRVSVTADLRQGRYQQCYACRHPLSDEDRQSELYEPGVRCPHCADLKVNRERFAQRQKQIALSAARGEAHIGQSQKEKRSDGR